MGALAEATATSGIAITDSRPTSRHIPAIDGLRAVAVLLVVLHHAEIPGFERGFIGVDMFFALSGFLITQRIVKNTNSGATQGLSSFWAGRARRILPAITLVIIVTCIASAALLSPQELERIGFYGITSNFFAVNGVIAYRGGNYFEGPLRESPFLHLWSLAVEEQFYLVWPLALGPVARFVTRRSGREYRSIVAVGMVIAGVVSLGVSVWMTDRMPLWAFYGLPSRIYEFVLG